MQICIENVDLPISFHRFYEKSTKFIMYPTKMDPSSSLGTPKWPNMGSLDHIQPTVIF